MDLWKAMVRVYASYEIDCVIDIYAPPPPDPGEALMTALHIRQVILLPSLDVCLARNRARNRQPFLADEDLRANYEDFASCVSTPELEYVIDNGTLTVDETVDAIDALLHDAETRR